MTSDCSICQHAKIQAINAALLSGRYFAVVSHQFRVDKDAMRVHAMEHHFRVDYKTCQTETSEVITIDEAVPSQVSEVRDAEETCEAEPRGVFNFHEHWRIHARPETAVDDTTWVVTENPLRQFTRAMDTVADAYRLADHDPRMQATMRERLEQTIKIMLQDEDMGIS